MDKRELNQNELADETGRDESAVSLPDETPKIQKKRRPKKRPPQKKRSLLLPCLICVSRFPCRVQQVNVFTLFTCRVFFVRSPAWL